MKFELQNKPAKLDIPQEVEELATIVVNAAFEVHRHHGPGLLESAYQACLCRELELRGLTIKSQMVIPLVYKGIQVEAGFRADIIVEDKLLIELKAVEAIENVHRAQVITYLKLLQMPLGILINFNETLIKNGIRRVLNLPKD